MKNAKSYRIGNYESALIKALMDEYHFENETDLIERAIMHFASDMLSEDVLMECMRKKGKNIE